jgi:hypothetical protein
MLTRLLAALALGAALIACTPAGGSSPAATVQPSVAAPSLAAPSDAAPSDAAPSMPAESGSPSAS